MTVCPWLAGWGRGGHSGVYSQELPAMAGCVGRTRGRCPGFSKTSSRERDSGKAQGPPPSCLPGSEQGSGISRVDEACCPGFQDSLGQAGQLHGPMRELTLRPSGECLSRLPVACGPQVLVWEVPSPGAQWSLDSRTQGMQRSLKCPSWTLPFSLRKCRYHIVPISQRHRLRL